MDIEIIRMTNAKHEEQLKMCLWRGKGEEPDMKNLTEKEHSYVEKSLNSGCQLDGDYFYVHAAKVDGKFVGYINSVMIPKADSRKGTLFIDELWVAKSYRRMGAAKLLMDEVIRLGEELGVWKMRLTVDLDNPGARKLYKDYGFSEKECIFGQRDL